MARFYQVQLENLYFTDSGLSTGTPCKLSVSGLAPLKTTFTGQTIRSASGKPYLHIVEINNSGKEIEIKIDYLKTSVLDDLSDLLNEAIENETSLTLHLTGDLGNFTLEVLPVLPDFLLISGEFSAAIARNITLKLITV